MREIAYVSQLLDRGHVVVGGQSRKTVCLGQAKSRLSGANPALRVQRKVRSEELSDDRVPPTKGTALDPKRLRAWVRRYLARYFLQVGGFAELSDEGNGRALLLLKL